MKKVVIMLGLVALICSFGLKVRAEQATCAETVDQFFSYGVMDFEAVPCDCWDVCIEDKVCQDYKQDCEDLSFGFKVMSGIDENGLLSNQKPKERFSEKYKYEAFDDGKRHFSADQIFDKGPERPEASEIQERLM